jgi:putative sterol carrier protein
LEEESEIMEKKEFQTRMMLYIMIESFKEIAKVDEDLQEDLEEMDTLIQWKVKNINAYISFKKGKIEGELDIEVENPTVILTIPNYDTAKGLLTGEIDGTSAYMAGDLTIEGNLADAMEFTSMAEILMDYLEPLLG